MFTEQEKRHIREVKDTIRFHIRGLKREFDWWKIVEENDAVYLTGGAIGSLLRNEMPKDWDFYFYSEDSAKSFKRILEFTYDDEIKEVNELYSEHKDASGRMITANAITMKSDDSFIFTFAGSPADLRKSFDFVHCLPFYTIMSDTLYISKQQYNACVNKKLIYNTDIKDVKQWRVEKFVKRGYTF